MVQPQFSRAASPHIARFGDLPLSGRPQMLHHARDRAREPSAKAVNVFMSKAAAFLDPLEASYMLTSAPPVAPTMKEGPMHYYIPQMLPEYVEVEPHVFQTYLRRNGSGLAQRATPGDAARQAPTSRRHTDGSACRQAPDCRERAAAPVFGKAGRPGKVQVPFRSLKPRSATNKDRPDIIRHAPALRRSRTA